MPGRSRQHRARTRLSRTYICGMASTGMTSTASPGKIAKCGWFSNSPAASSCEAARTTLKPVSALLISVTPLRRSCGSCRAGRRLDDDVLVLLDPAMPAGHALALFRLPLGLGKRIPDGHFRPAHAAEIDGEEFVSSALIGSLPCCSYVFRSSKPAAAACTSGEKSAISCT